MEQIVLKIFSFNQPCPASPSPPTCSDHTIALVYSRLYPKARVWVYFRALPDQPPSCLLLVTWFQADGELAEGTEESGGLGDERAPFGTCSDGQ